MKHFVLLLLLVSFHVCKAQFTEADKKALYPKTYSIEQAIAFEEKGQYDRAIWIYINLFPDHREKVVENVKAMAEKLDTNMHQFIVNAFSLYAPFDPESGNIEKGEFNMENIQKKGAWGDELIQKVTGESPISTPEEYNQRGTEKFKSGNLEGAIEDFDKALELRPSFESYYNRGYAKSYLKDWDGAIADYDKAAALPGDGMSRVYYERGYCKDQLGKLDEAIADYDLSIKADKKFPDAWNNRAVVKLKKKDYKGAIRDFDKAIKLRPGFSAGYVNRGFAKLAAGKQKEACADWQKALDMGFGMAKDIMLENCK